MKKAPEAFRTISEVSDILDTPAHVLRFWESKFYQIRPVKRAGGRRYYRPDDMALLAGIRLLLQDQGMTIRGVQKVLQEQGVRHVASLAPDPSVEASFEAENQSERDAAQPARDNAAETAHRADAPAAPETAPPPRPVQNRPAPPLPLLPETPEAAPEASPAIAPAASSDAHSAAADRPADNDAAAEEAQDGEAPKAGPVHALPDQPPADPHAAEPESNDLPPPDLPGPEPTVTARTPVPPPPDLSDHALNLGAGGERPAQLLRGLPRDALATERDKAAMLARRLDALLDRMSDASGAGRW